ncbi:MAG: helix-turn-helix domain-containing protein [Bacteriovorax sp.]|nr:helix-turn-helix domain-containing protein [Bacteriovorax sp.]
MIEELSDMPFTKNESQQIQAGHAVSIGELLRSRREEKGLNLKNMSFRTKIHIGLLVHLENNELSKLPNKIYVRGFVSSAAKILEINQAEALDILESTYNPNNKIIKIEATTDVGIKNENARNPLTLLNSIPYDPIKSVFSNTLLAKVVVCLFIVGASGFSAKYFIERSAENRLKLTKALSSKHQEIKSMPKVVESEIISKPAATELVQPEPIKVNEKTEITINDVSFKSFTKTLKQFTEDNSMIGDELEEIFPSRYKVSLNKGIDNIFINAVDGDSWITYKVDDKEIKKYVLRQGRKVFISGENIRLFLKNASAVKIFYNNKLISLNDKRSIKNLVFPEEVKTQFMYPLFVFQNDGTVITSEEYISANRKATSTSSIAPKKSL